jgi:hypothetical protein
MPLDLLPVLFVLPSNGALEACIRRSPKTQRALVHYRLTSLERGALEILQSDESKWQSPEIFPVTATITDGAGHLEMCEIDPRPKRIN